jgi:signal transduction histidine kinase
MPAAFVGRFTAAARENAYGSRRPRADAAIWTGAMAVLTAAAIVSEAPSERAAHLILDLAVGVVSVALVPLLARWQVPAAIALNLLSALSPAATPAATMSVLVTSRWQRLGRALLVAGTGIAAHLIRGAWRPAGLPYGWWAVVIVAAYAALTAWGMLWRANSALITSLRERAEQAESDQARRVTEARTAERTRIAREMHDVLAHRLSLLATYAGALAYRPDAPPEQVSRAAEVVRAGAHQALDELREVIGLLREDDLPDLNATGRPVPGAGALPQLIEESRAAGTPVEAGGTAWDEVSGGAETADGAGAADGPGASGVPEVLGRTAYRVVQEALTNVRKHAPGEAARVALDGGPGDGLTITVVNRLRPPGPGAAGQPEPVPGSGTGVIGLTERVELAGGRLECRARDGEYTLSARLPWPA